MLRDDNPQSIRHVFYRMTDPRLPEPVEKSVGADDERVLLRGERHDQMHGGDDDDTILGDTEMLIEGFFG